MDPGSSSSWPHHHQQDDLDEPPPPWPHHHHLTDHSFPPPPSPLTQRTLCDTSGSDTPEADEAPEGDPHMCSPLVENPRMSGHHSEVHLAEPHYTGEIIKHPRCDRDVYGVYRIILSLPPRRRGHIRNLALLSPYIFVFGTTP